MTLHREGYLIMLIAFFITGGIASGVYFMPESLLWLKIFLWVGLFILFYLIVQFFRVPKRIITQGEDLAVCPADGKVVVIEEVMETEFFNEKRIQVSIFMSPMNVHVNWFPIGGTVCYSKYHAGKYLVAWHPKSSTENERTTVVVEDHKGRKVLFRQIAGAMARRIVNYAKEGNKAEQAREFGFIKFGSRVDIFLPLDAEILVQLNQKTTGSVTPLAKLK
ncbi:MAG: phosphatidylserine decarboxylase family protein [Flavobacteriales bacterium]|nr:phosphatidylserine decarboxylase family protein [Flavobacteriales bacterium]